MYTCIACGAVLANETMLDIPNSAMPEEWSIVQVKTTGIFAKRSFEVIGHVRMQMRKEYKNYWCLWYPTEGKYGWMVESLGFYAICTDTFFEMDNPDTIKKIKSTATIKVSQQSSVIIEEVDFCEGLIVSGEIHSWSYGDRFFVAQGKKGNTIAAFLHFFPQKDRVKFLLGEWAPVESLQLKNINTAHAW